jgi:hypothetical protein
MWDTILIGATEGLINFILWSAILIGVLLIFLGKIKFLSNLIQPILPYLLAAKILGVVLLLGGVYYKGSFDNELSHRKEVAELKSKLKDAEERAKKTNVVIEERIVKEIQYVDRVKIQVKTKIKEVEKIINEKCQLDPAAVEIHNQSALNQLEQPK